ncbi:MULTISPECIES: SusC/RagA family TonB-linked outer membrane protein [Sphingobacterium]|uniref:SusC/RagA family TonB-linked outer membrane protein n=1 Tax=Sphingobacterium TaxID=28453 RepID=UPI0013DAAFC8|nr:MULTISPECIES: TonB-dependent receptor [unclassified Sphingobacterium]
MMKLYKAGLYVLLLLMVDVTMAQQRIPVRGIVTNSGGEPILGASVREKGGKASTSTNNKGNFSIEVSEGAILVVSSVGYTANEVVAKSQVRVSLESDDADIEEVVVVGYGTQKKSNLTSSVSTIDQKAFESRPVSNVMSAMQGAAPGLVITRSGGQPGAEGFLANIRGELSTGGSSPLVLIDGVPGSLTYTNPDDIASISILKDASATAIYGSRGASGVILVTTKTGNGKAKVNYQGMWTSKKLGLFPERISSWEEAEMQNMARINAGQSPDWSPELIALMKDPTSYYRINPSNANQYQYFGNFNYPDLLLRDRSTRLNQNISISGSTDKDNYLFSLGYVKDKGVFKFGPDDYNRLNARFNYSRQLFNKISLESKVLYSRSERNSSVLGASNDYGLIYRIVSSRSTYPIYLPESNDKLYAAGSAAGETVGLLKDGGRNNNVIQEIGSTFQISTNDLLTEGLNFRLLYSPRFLIDSDNNTRVPVPMYDISGRTGWAGGINLNSISKERGLTISNNWQFVSEYNRTFSQKHEVLARAGYRYDDYRYDYIVASAQNLPTDDILALRQFSEKNNTSVSDNIQTNALISFFGTAQYVYDSRYIIQATLNREGSSRLSPKNRWITLPGVSAGWRINNESWFGETSTIFSDLKLRASWGKQANDPNSGDPRASNYDYVSRLSKGDAYPFNDVRNTYYWIGTAASPLRKWEEVTNTDVGLDFATLGRRLEGSFSYFWRETNGTYGVMPQPGVFGIGSPSANVGDFKSWGWELSVNWKDKIGEGFEYFVSANIADNNNKIIKYLNRNTVGAGLNPLIEGYAKNSIFGYQTDGYFQSADEIKNNTVNHGNSNLGPGDIRYVDVNGDKVISAGRGTLEDMGDLVFMGTQNPRYSYGFNLGFNFKGIDFSAFIQGVGKRQYLLPSILTLPYTESWRQAWAIHRDYWTPENPDAKFPRLLMGGGTNTRVSDKWIVNGAYARLKNIQIGYTLPTDMTKKAAMQKVRVFFSGEDLFETKKSWHPYYDPETPNNQAFGYPFFRSFTFGANLIF